MGDVDNALPAVLTIGRRASHRAVKHVNLAPQKIFPAMSEFPKPAKIDLKKELHLLYKASAKKVEEVTVPPLKYLMVDGRGDPNTSREYAEAVAALFTVSYTLKFALKKMGRTPDYTVMPLEGLWWANDWSAFVGGDKAKWKWTMMILQPAFAADEAIENAIADVRAKKNLPALRKLRVEEFSEGR